VDPAMESAQVENVRAVRAARDAAVWRLRIQELYEAARGTENLMPRIMAAAEAYATVGEISDTLRAVFGEYREV
jgi:methylmalonyl-CoA mutase N-terminal domain/subunit